MDSGGVSSGKSVAVAVGCLHFNGTSMALQRYCFFYPHRSIDSVSPVCGIFLVLLSASVERVGVSRMRDFLFVLCRVV